MPEGVAAFVVVELEDLELAIVLERASHVPEHAIDLRDERAVGQILRDFTRNIKRRRMPLLRLLDAAVGESNLDRIRREREALSVLLRQDGLEETDALRNRRAEVRLVLRVSNHGGGGGGGETVNRRKERVESVVGRSGTAETD